MRICKRKYSDCWPYRRISLQAIIQHRATDSLRLKCRKWFPCRPFCAAAFRIAIVLSPFFKARETLLLTPQKICLPPTQHELCYTASQHLVVVPPMLGRKVEKTDLYPRVQVYSMFVVQYSRAPR